MGLWWEEAFFTAITERHGLSTKTSQADYTIKKQTLGSYFICHNRVRESRPFNCEKTQRGTKGGSIQPKEREEEKNQPPPPSGGRKT